MTAQNDIGPTLSGTRDSSLDEAEWSVLGGLLHHPDLLHQVAQVLDATDWSKPNRAAIYALMLARAQQGKKPDPVETVWAVANLRDTAITAYDVPSLIEGGDRVVSSADLLRLAAMVARESSRRKVLRALKDGIDLVAADEDPLLAGQGVSVDLLMLWQGKGAQQDEDAARLADESLDALEDRAVGRGPQGISTGIDELDALIRLDPGRLYIVAARPGIGKSALAAHFIRADAGRRGWGVLSMEMSGREWTDRLICAEAEVNVQAYGLGNIDDEDWTRVVDARDRVRKWRYLIDARAGLTWAQVASKVRQWHMLGKIDAAVVDYLGLIRKRDPRMSTYDHITEVTQAAKALARELRIPVVMLAQLNRDVEKRGDKRPIASDLRDSGSIEQDADVILMLHREGAYDDNADPNAAEVLVRKNRGGPQGMARARWDGQWCRFGSWGGA